MNDWIKKLCDSPMWLSEPFTKSQAWIDLVFLASPKDSLLVFRNNTIPVRRGQIAMSERSLAERWKWSRVKTRNFMKYLIKDQKIDQQKASSNTLISIIGYDLSTTNSTTNGTTKGTTESTRTKKEKVEKKAFVPPSLEEVKNYFRENGYKISVAEMAFRGYAENNWHDAHNNKIENWKLKMNHVWFREDNKEPEPITKSWAKANGYSTMTLEERDALFGGR